jgi:GTP-binding protein HflX
VRKAVLFADLDFIDEATDLAFGAGFDVVEKYKLPKRPNPKYFIQQDKLFYIKDRSEIDAVIIFDLLKPRNFINIKKELINKEILDKTLLLLEIFALHAGSKEAKLQIELARMKYEIPILKESYTKAKITEQQGPLGAGTYGVESIIKLYNRRIVKITKDLESLKKFKETMIHTSRNVGIPTVSIVGYTNAGKTTIFNVMTGLSQKVDSTMFTTMSPKRSSISKEGKKVMLVDTVGFIRAIPPQIVDAFFVTLSEAKNSNFLMLVLDSSLEDSIMLEYLRSSIFTLREIGISGKPMLIVLNKIDKIREQEVKSKIEIVENVSKDLYCPIIAVVPVSALKGMNISSLRDEIFKMALG